MNLLPSLPVDAVCFATRHEYFSCCNSPLLSEVSGFISLHQFLHGDITNVLLDLLDALNVLFSLAHR